MNNMNETGINDRLIIDYDNIGADVENILNEIDALRHDKLFAKSLGADFSQNVKDNCASVKKRLHGAFNIVVIGDFKRGKSTFINALIGEDIVPTAVAPETVTINMVSYSETPKAEAVLKNGKRAALSYNELKREAIEKIAGQLPAEIDFIDIKANAEILKDISVIDTPGIGDLFKVFDQRVTDYLVNADAVIYIISAKMPLSATEQTFLSSAVIPQNFSRIFAIVNMADTLETAENINKIAEHTKEKTTAISPDINLFVLSALDELCRKKGLKRPEPELANLLENNFLEFETALNNDIILQKNIIKLMRAAALAENLTDNITGRINLIINSIKANSEKLLSSEEEFKNKNAELLKFVDGKKADLALDIDGMKAEARGWIKEFLSRLKNEIEAIQSTASVSDLERHFQFFMSDVIKNAVVSCVERHQKDFSDKLTDFSKDISEEVTKNTFGTTNTKIADSITDISWTGLDSAMHFSEFIGIPQLLGSFYIIGQVIGGFVRQQTVSKKQSDFLSPVLQNFNSITDDVINNMNSVYEQIKLKAVDKLDELFQNQINASAEAISQAKKISADEEIKSEQVIEYLDSVLSSLRENRQVLEKYR